MPGSNRTLIINLHFLNVAQMTEALLRGEILQAYMILQDSVLINIVNSNGEDMLIKGHRQDRVLITIVNSSGEDMTIKGKEQDRILISHGEGVIIEQDSVLNNIVNSTGENVIIKSHKQDRVAINFVNSNKEGAITKGHKLDSGLISGKQVTTVISDKVDTIHSCDEPVSHLNSKQVIFVTSNTVHSFGKLAARRRKVKVTGMRTSTTTSGWSLATSTSTNRSKLFLVGEGLHW